MKLTKPKILSSRYTKPIVAVLLILLALLQLAASYFPGNLILEWIVSFTPYFWLLDLTLLLLGAIYIFLYRRDITKIVNIVIFKVKLKTLPEKSYSLYLLAVSLLIFVFIMQTLQIISFSYSQPSIEKSIEQGSGQKFKVAFFNKLYTNSELRQIRDEIIKVNPDIIGFAELTTNDSRVLNKNLELEQTYHYSYYATMQTIASDVRSGVAIYSKYPISAENTELDKYLPYLSVKINLPGGAKDPTVVVIHTTAPIIQRYLNQRNRQLPTLVQGLEQQKREGEPLILMGDFNLTPWSPSYREFSQQLPWLINSAQGEELQLTWRNQPHQPLLGAQIDQIFHSSEIRSENFNVEANLGSDHHLIWTEIDF